MKKLKFILAVLLCFSLFVGCSKQIDREDMIATVGGKAISKSEYMLYLYEATRDFNEIGGNDIWETDFDGQSAEDVVKERAFTTMLHIKVTADKASRYKVSLSEEDKAVAQMRGEAELASMTEEQKNIVSLSEEDVYKIMEDTLLYQKVIEAVTKDYHVSEADFNAYFEQNKEIQRKAYTEYTISAISVTDQQAAQEVFQRFTEGEDFQTLFQTYETNPQQKQTGGVVTTYKSRVVYSLVRACVFEVVENKEPISIEGCYVVIRIDKKSIPDDTALKELMRSEYTSSIKQQAFTDELNQWLADIEIERNEAVWNTIEMIP